MYSVGVVIVVTEVVDEYVRLLVEDSGQGIDEEIRVRMFDFFFSIKEIGMGFGLVLVQ